MTGHVVPPPYDASAHATIVAEVHDTQLHETDGSSDELGLRSIELKFSPKIDTEAPPVGAMFDGPLLLTAGAAQNRGVTLAFGKVRPAEAVGVPLHVPARADGKNRRTHRRS